ncbi:DsbA family protein [Siccirubricoccus deserti]
MDDRTEAGAACGPDGCAVPAETTMALPLARAPSRIDIISDAICPWCWVGKRNLEGALALLAVEGERFEIHWRPFQLNPDMPREGWSGRPTARRSSAAPSARRRRMPGSPPPARPRGWSSAMR